MRFISIATYVALTQQVRINEKGDSDALDYVPHSGDKEPEATHSQLPVTPSIEDDTPITTMADIPRFDHAPEIQKDNEPKVEQVSQKNSSQNASLQDKFQIPPLRAQAMAEFGEDPFASSGKSKMMENARELQSKGVNPQSLLNKTQNLANNYKDIHWNVDIMTQEVADDKTTAKWKNVTKDSPMRNPIVQNEGQNHGAKMEFFKPYQMKGPSKLIFNEEFNELNQDLWKHTIASDGFHAYVNNRTNTYTKNGVLHVQPTLMSDTYGEQRLLNGTIDLNKRQERCSPHDDGCVLEVPKSGKKTGQMLPPVQSAKIQTKGAFSFKYGRMEAKVKFPKGKWLWPSIWMLSDENKYGDDQDGEIPFSGEIDIIEPRGHPTSINENIFAVHGSDHDVSWRRYGEISPITGDHFDEGYHTFGLKWTKNRIQGYLDTEDQTYMDFDTSHLGKDFPVNGKSSPYKESGNAPFDQRFYLIINMSIAGSYFGKKQFPDKCWEDENPLKINQFWQCSNDWYPTWNYPETDDASLKIDSIKVWQYPQEDPDSSYELNVPQKYSPMMAMAPTYGVSPNPFFTHTEVQSFDTTKAK